MSPRRTVRRWRAGRRSARWRPLTLPPAERGVAELPARPAAEAPGRAMMPAVAKEEADRPIAVDHQVAPVEPPSRPMREEVPAAPAPVAMPARAPEPVLAGAARLDTAPAARSEVRYWD